MRIELFVTLLSAILVSFSGAFVVRPSASISETSWRTSALKEREKDFSPLGFLFNPYESTIPEEIRKEIYDAEANTPAAKDRSKRIALYAILAFVGVLGAFFNGFLTELRSGPTPDGSPVALSNVGFGWVEANFLFKFLFLNKIGGGLLLLGGAGSGLLAEAEFDTRRINAEKIWEELQRRREAKTEKPKKSSTKKKRRSGKEAKRIQALAEVVSADADVTEESEETPERIEPVSEKQEEKKGGVFSQVKEFYEKADKMAASQALLLNKELEDRGIVEKITDETGLKVIGKDAASKLKKDKDIED